MEPASPFVTSKFFGVTPEQAQRVQALLRLGVTDDDVRVAERLMRSRSGSQSEGSDNKDLKLEEMSRLKALEVLGISSEMLEDDKAKILGSLGVPTWGNSGISTVIDRDRNAGGTWNLFSKRRHTASAAPGMPAPICGMIAPAPTQMGVAELEDECLSQHLRIQELELQVATLTELSRTDK